MATDVITPAAPAAAPSSAPASAPAASSPAPVSAPAPVSTPVESAPAPISSTPTSKVDPAKYPIREDYAKALLAEKMAAISADAQPEETAVADPAAETAPETVEVAAPDAEAAPVEEAAKPEETAPPEEDFQLEPEPIVTPESLSQMVQENAEFGKLLEADPKLKGQLYKTAREAAELQPYREIFPDIESAKTASQSAATWNDVRDTFMGSTTQEGTIAALNKIAELSYERDADGNVVMQNGEPVIGDDFYGFVENIESLGLKHRNDEVTARLQANRYTDQAARDHDEALKAALDILQNEAILDAPQELPPALKQREEAIARREAELNQRNQTEKVAERQTFEKGLQDEAQKRITDGITRIIGNVEKQGAVISPYLKNVLPKAIASKLVQKIKANPSLQAQMRELQRLPIGDDAKTRRNAAIDRAVQQYLPEVARAELREAGVQAKANAEAKQAKIQAQADATKKTEPKGSTGAVTSSGAAMTAKAADAQAQAEWKAANPGKPFDKIAQEQILPRILQLMNAPV